MRHDDADSDQPSFRKGAQRDPARLDTVLECVPLGLIGMFAVAVRIPGRGAPVPTPLHQLPPPLLVDEVDAFGPIDLTDAV